MTPEDRQEVEFIVQQAIENAFLKLPEITSKMLVRHYALTNAWKKFWKDNPQYSKHGQLVAEIVSKVDSENPGMDYDSILAKSKARIEIAIKQSTNLNMDKVEKPSKEERNLGVLA